MGTPGGLLRKNVYCPVCVHKIAFLKPRVGASKPLRHDTDFHTIYSGTNPLYYDIIVCPKCHYAAHGPEFRDIRPEEIKAYQALQSTPAEGDQAVDFTGERDARAALASYRLAVRAYGARAQPHETIGGLYLRLAWLHRETGETAEERAMIREALVHYQRAFEEQKVIKSTLGEVGLLYLMGELNRRIGNGVEAVRWFGRCVARPQIGARPDIEKLARDQWMEAKKQAPADPSAG